MINENVLKIVFVFLILGMNSHGEAAPDAVEKIALDNRGVGVQL